MELEVTLYNHLLFPQSRMNVFSELYYAVGACFDAGCLF